MFNKMAFHFIAHSRKFRKFTLPPMELFYWSRKHSPEAFAINHTRPVSEVLQSRCLPSHPNLAYRRRRFRFQKDPPQMTKAWQPEKKTRSFKVANGDPLEKALFFFIKNGIPQWQVCSIWHGYFYPVRQIELKWHETKSRFGFHRRMQPLMLNGFGNWRRLRH